MEVNIEDVSSVKKIVHVEIPEPEVQKEIDEAYDELKKNARVKGFRKGKAPRSVLKRLYKKDIHNDVASKLIQETLPGVIRENNLLIIGQPEVDPIELEEKSPFRYKATVEIKPELGEVDHSGISLKKNAYTVGTEEIDKQINALRKKVAELKPILEDRPVQENDFVVIDYEGFKDGQLFEGFQKTEDFTLQLGKDQAPEEFQKNLIGMKPGETRTFNVQFPENASSPELSGQVIEFRVILKEIRYQELPEINDALAQKFGKDTIEQLRGEIESNLKEGYEKRTQQELSEQVYKELLNRVDFEVPETLVQAELEQIVRDAEQTFAYHNKTLEDVGLTREIMSERYRETAENQVKRQMLLHRIAEQENLEVSDEEVKAAMEEMEKSMNMPYQDIKDFYDKNKEHLEHLKLSILEKKANELIINNSAIEEVEPESDQETSDQQITDQTVENSSE